MGATLVDLFEGVLLELLETQVDIDLVHFGAVVQLNMYCMDVYLRN